MSEDPVTSIHEALDILGLPPMISYKDLKKRYRELSKKYHPDIVGDSNETMVKINQAYNLVKNYMENYRFSFSEEEILKQFPYNEYIKKFRF